MILFSTGTLYCYGLERIFRIAHKSGFKNVELFLRIRDENAYMDSYDENYLKSLEKKYKIKIVSIHPMMNFSDVFETELPAILMLAKKIKAKHIIIHTPDKKWTKNIKWFKNIYFENLINQPIFLTENLGKKTILDDTNNLKKLPNLCYDISHAMESGHDVLKDIIVLNNIRQLHISNFDGKRCHMDVLKNKKFFEKVLSINKKPIKCLEMIPAIFDDLKNEKQVINHLKNTREFLEKFE